MLLEGLFLPLTTSFHADGRLFTSKLSYNVERYSRSPASGFVALGDLGEADALSDEEAREVLSAIAQAADVSKVLVASVGRESVLNTLKLAEFAAECGYDGIALRAPAFCAEPAMQAEVKIYFQAVADTSALPVVLVSEQRRTLTTELILSLASHPNIVGLIDDQKNRVSTLTAGTTASSREVEVTNVFAAATRRMLQAASAASTTNLGGVALLDSRSTLKTRRKKVGFQIMTATTSEMLASWQTGASGSVPRLGVCAPQACCEVWQAFKDGDAALAEEKQDRLRTIARNIDGAHGVALAKYGADFNGYYGGYPRLPLLGLIAEHQRQLEHELAGMRN